MNNNQSCESEPSTELAQIEDIQNLLPMLPVSPFDPGDESDQNAPQKLNYRELMSREASLPLVAGYMSYEVQLLKYGKTTEDDEKAGRLSRAANGILDLVDGGGITRMSDAHEVICLVEETNPSISKIKDLILNRGYTAAGVAYLYDAKDLLRISIDLTDQAFRTLGLDLMDETDVAILDDAIDAVCEKQNIRYRDSAMRVILELCEDGLSLVEIAHGRTS